jgi:chromate transporter
MAMEYGLERLVVLSAHCPARCKPAYDNRSRMHSPPSGAETPSTPPQPRSPRDLFTSFTWLALQGFGGVLAIVQRELVEKKRWITPEQFIEDWAVAQVLPGPNVINLSLMIGDRYFGLRGALAALAGILTVPLGLILVLAVVYAQYAGNPQVAGALRGMGAVSGGLIAATGIKLIPQLRKHPLGFAACLVFVAVVFGAIALLHVPLGWVLLTVGVLSCAWTWRRLLP